MLTIKIILISLLIVLYAFLKFNRRGRRSHIRFISLGFLALAMLAILFPQLTTRAAHFLGIGRGVDLLFYLIIVFILFMIAGLRLRAIQTQHNITLLTRQIAFMQSRPADTAAPPRNDTP